MLFGTNLTEKNKLRKSIGLDMPSQMVSLGGSPLSTMANQQMSFPDYVNLPRVVSNMAQERRKARLEQGPGGGTSATNGVARRAGRTRESLFGY